MQTTQTAAAHKLARDAAAAGSKGPTLSQQLKAIKAVLASKVAELDAANALLVHVPNNLRESLPNPDVRVVHNSDRGAMFGRG